MIGRLNLAGIPSPIPITGLSLTGTRTLGSTGGGGTRGRATFDDITIVKPIDQFTVDLTDRVLSGRAIATASIELVAGQDVYATIDLHNVFVTSVAAGAADGNEAVALTFDRIGFTGDGSVAPAPAASLGSFDVGGPPASPVAAFKWNAVTTVVSGSGGAGTGRPTVSDFDVTIPVDDLAVSLLDGFVNDANPATAHLTHSA